MRAISSKSPFQSQASNVWRLTLSANGVFTATIQLFLLSSIARRQRIVSSRDTVGGGLFTVRASIRTSYVLVDGEETKR